MITVIGMVCSQGLKLLLRFINGNAPDALGNLTFAYAVVVRCKATLEGSELSPQHPMRSSKCFVSHTPYTSAQMKSSTDVLDCLVPQS